MNAQIKRVFMTLLLSVVCLFAMAQKTIHGTVKAADGEPLIGVTVMVDGKAGAITDLDGNFTINNVAPSAVLKVSYIGYTEQTIKVGNKVQFDIVMNEDTQTLADVVVVGYGTMKKSDLSGSSVSVGEKAIKGSVITSLDQSLQGRAAGVTAVSTSGAPGTSLS